MIHYLDRNEAVRLARVAADRTEPNSARHNAYAGWLRLVKRGPSCFEHPDGFTVSDSRKALSAWVSA